MYISLKFENRFTIFNEICKIRYNFHKIIPIEVKWSETPNKSDIKHLLVFMKEHKLTKGYVVCRCLKKLQLVDGVIAYPWGCLPELLSGL